MALLIGTSGWQYKHWRERFYPRGLPQRAWLEHYVESFQTVESNNAFYRLPERKTFEAWRVRTPEDFVWTVKMSRYLTHLRRLREPAEPVARFLERATGLGDKLGPVLLQFPPNFKLDLGALEATLDLLIVGLRVAVEFRHDSWWRDDVRAALEERGVALCLADRGSQPVTPLWRTAGWGYVRFHEGRAAPHPCYGRAALESWSHRIAELWGAKSEVFAFFNNDPGGCALRDARTFARTAGAAGLRPSRVPSTAVRVD